MMRFVFGKMCRPIYEKLLIAISKQMYNKISLEI